MQVEFLTKEMADRRNWLFCVAGLGSVGASVRSESYAFLLRSEPY